MGEIICKELLKIFRIGTQSGNNNLNGVYRIEEQIGVLKYELIFQYGNNTMTFQALDPMHDVKEIEIYIFDHINRFHHMMFLNFSHDVLGNHVQGLTTCLTPETKIGWIPTYKTQRIPYRIRTYLERCFNNLEISQRILDFLELGRLGLL